MSWLFRTACSICLLLLISSEIFAGQQKNTNQILQEIEEYQKKFQKPIGSEISNSEDWRPENFQFIAAVQQRVDCYLAALKLLEYLIRMRMIDRDEAVKLSWELRTHDLLYAIPFNLIETEKGWWRVGQEQLAEADEAYHHFLTHTYLTVPKLTKGETPDPIYQERWAGPIIESAVRRVDRPYLLPEDLAYLKRIMTEVVPDNVGSSLQLEQFFSYGPLEFGPAKFENQITLATWTSFLQELSDSNHRVANLYSRYGLIRLRWMQFRNPVNRSALQQLLIDVEALQNDFAKLPVIKGQEPRTQEWTYGRISDLHSFIKHDLESDQ
jgi:hypothetical protein